MKKWICVIVFLLGLSFRGSAWMADNGNGTYSNPLFYDEFSDPDLIRVGGDYYLTGTTMHTMPGLPVLHSKDLVNWDLLGYVFDRLDLGPEFRLENGKEIYGQGIWAPSFRYHNGTFHIFSNINRHKTQLFRATNPAGPWTHSELNRSLHDLSVLFDDDGKIYVVWGYRDLHFAQLNAELTDIVPGTERTLFGQNDGMGEGSHFYKINGKYYIFSAWFDRRMRLACARADKPEGPYEVNKEVSADEDFGVGLGWRLGRSRDAGAFQLFPPDDQSLGHMALHQGGVVDTPSGEWWGFSMMDHNSVGRLTCLSPVTWTNGWAYFGLPGNLERTPETWVKPNTGFTSPPSAPYQRNDDFSGPKLANVWQWNHMPDDSKWSLTERPGFLRLHSLPAPDFWSARNSLTQRAIGPESTPTASLDASGLQPGDVAGLALLNQPYGWIGVARETNGLVLEQFNQITGATERKSLDASNLWLRAHCDFDTEKADFSYSIDGKAFLPFGGQFTMVFQLKTFQGIRYSLFNFNTNGAPGGFADFDSFKVDELRSRGLTKPIPVGATITLTSISDGSVLVAKNGTLQAVPASDPAASSAAARFVVMDLGLGRIALNAGMGGFVTVSASGGAGDVKVTQLAGELGYAQTFQWEDMQRGDIMLLSLVTDRSISAKPGETGPVSADSPGPHPDRKEGSCFTWKTALNP